MITESESEFPKLTFHEWMNRKYGDDWPVDDGDLNIWRVYLDYIQEDE